MKKKDIYESIFREIFRINETVERLFYAENIEYILKSIIRISEIVSNFRSVTIYDISEILRKFNDMKI